MGSRSVRRAGFLVQRGALHLTHHTHTLSLSLSLCERCALAGDQAGQGHAVGCEAGKLCELVDTVLKGGFKRQLAETQKHMTSPWRHWSARPGAVSLLCCAGSAIARAMAFWPGKEARQWGRELCSKPAVQWWLSLNSSTPTQSELAGLSCLSSRRRCRRGAREA